MPGKPMVLRGLDRDVHAIMSKIEDADGSRLNTVGKAYDAIKRSNSSVSRQKKRPLEDAIDRVLQFRKAEEADGEDSEAELDAEADREIAKHEDDRFLLNRQLTKLWRDDPADSQRDNEKDKAKDDRNKDQEQTKEQPADRPSKRRKTRDERDAKESGPDTAAEAVDGKPAPKKLSKPARFHVESGPEAPRLGGVDETMRKMRHRLPHLLSPDADRRACLKPFPGFIVAGPPGVGKNSVVRKLAADSDIPLLNITRCFRDPDRLEKSLTEAMDEAMRLAPCIVFIANVDVYLHKADSTSSTADVSRRVVDEFRAQMGRVARDQPADRPVVPLATTSALANVDPAVLRSDLFSGVVQMRTPDLAARREILECLLAPEVVHDIKYDELAKMTHGYVGRDLFTLLQEACMRASSRPDKVRRESAVITDHGVDVAMENGASEAILDGIAQDPAEPCEPVTMDDFKAVVKHFVPSLRQEGFTAVPDVPWDHVGAMRDIRDKLHMAVIGPIKNPDLYLNFGLNKPSGVLLWGPPGCGKTLVAQAVANEAQASFILINGPELLNKYVGESERAVRDLFQRARSSTPCILFFDEIDSLVPRRAGGGTEASTRVVNALLTELDGVGDRTGIYVIGTTNRPDMIDEAMLRPGRLNDRLYVGLPSEDERVDILRTIYRARRTDAASDHELAALDAVARDPRCANFSGADLSGLQIRASQSGLRRFMSGRNPGKMVGPEDWEEALANTSASVSNPELYRMLHDGNGKDEKRKKKKDQQQSG